MTYEEFKQLAEHPQHRDVPAIFKLEVLVRRNCSV